MAITIKKEISLGQIVTFATLVMGGVGAIYALETRVSDLEVHRDQAATRAEVSMVRDDLHEIKTDLRDIRNAVIDYLGNEANRPVASARRNNVSDSSGGKP